MSVTFGYRVTSEDLAVAFEKLKDFVSIPSVSNPHSEDYNMASLQAAANFAEGLLTPLGFRVEQISIGGSAPFVIAEKIVDARLPTILCYAHYDLQPVDRPKWSSDPYVLEERDGRLYGRGSADDKGGIICLVTALGAYLKQYEAFPCNVKMICEGEEEFHSTHMAPLLEAHSERLKADAMIIMDGGNLDVDTGTLTTSTRGLINLTVTVETMDKPVHSGVGCLVPDPAAILSDLITSLKDPREIPGFMDDCIPLNEVERALLRESSQSAESYAADHKLFDGAELRGSSELSIYERIAEEPSISIVNGGWGMPHGGNSIQNQATAQIGVRLTAGQDPDKMIELMKAYLLAQDVQGARITIETEDGCSAWKGDLSRPFTQRYIGALKENFPKTNLQPSGGALPLLDSFAKTFPEMEVIIPGVEDPDCSAHSHNESLHKGVFERSVNAFINFLERV